MSTRKRAGRRSKPEDARGRQGKLRCAIYTRKSSEEGLEQDFNSLDAQREACEAYIASQKHEGWVLHREMYDDGGFSGGTMERPALQRLLVDIAAGKVDVAVVYKVDRLTRALSDFAKIVDVFDAQGVSFVSVTQQFNTTTSMGRLTLNVLLSFAQFEREVTGERIRDKIAASKKKGMWMGGQPPLGYDVKDRKLIVNQAEAEAVRAIFHQYKALRSVRLLKAYLDSVGIISKARRLADGSPYGSKPLARGALYLMLQNRIYRGEIVHKDKSYPGNHDAIIDEALWNEVQAILAENRVDRTTGRDAKEPSLLGGILYDAAGERMTPSHAVKNGTRYRYYVSAPLVTGGAKKAASGQRIPAISLEAVVKRRIREWLGDEATVLDALLDGTTAGVDQNQLLAAVGQRTSGWDTMQPEEIRAALLSICPRVQVHTDRVGIDLDGAALLHWLTSKIGDAHETHGRKNRAEGRPVAPTHGRNPEGDILLPRRDDKITLSTPARLRRTGKEMRLVVGDGSEPAEIDPGLVRVLVRAHAIADQLLGDSSLSPNDMAAKEGIVPSYATRLYRLTFLAPDVIEAMLDGRQPPGLTVRKLLDDTRLPLDWTQQRGRLGFS
jgi:site-specific DNA recombinase